MRALPRRGTVLRVLLGGVVFLAGISFVAWHFPPSHRHAEILRRPADSGAQAPASASVNRPEP